ncbi:Far1 [Hordeum vulgare]|nr:Far1 [Hordeum vulgare]
MKSSISGRMRKKIRRTLGTGFGMLKVDKLVSNPLPSSFAVSMLEFLLGIGSPPLMVTGTILTLEHVMQRLDAIENKIATVELIEGLDRKIHNQITQYGSKVGNFLKNLKEKELIVNDSSRIGKLENVITNLGSAFAPVQNTPNLTLKKTVKPVFVPRASGESSNKDEKSEDDK